MVLFSNNVLNISLKIWSCCSTTKMTLNAGGGHFGGRYLIVWGMYRAGMFFSELKVCLYSLSHKLYLVWVRFMIPLELTLDILCHTGANKSLSPTCGPTHTLKMPMVNFMFMIPFLMFIIDCCACMCIHMHTSLHVKIPHICLFLNFI